MRRTRPASRRIDRSRHGLPPLIQALEVRQLLTVPTIEFGAFHADGREAEPHETAAFTFYILDGEGPVTINYHISGGSATNGDDYQHITTNRIVIPDKSTHVYLNVTPIDDTLSEGDETVVLTIDSGDYILGSSTSSSATVTIHDNEPEPAKVRI